MAAKSLHIHIFAAAALGPGVSGGDKIFIECARRWAEKGHAITVYATEEGLQMSQRYGLNNVRFSIVPVPIRSRIGFSLHYLLKIFRALLLASRLRLDGSYQHAIYSASDSLPDVLPSCLLRTRYPAVRWVAAFYFFAPTPWGSKRDEAYRGGRLPASFRSAVYFLFQQLAYPLIRRYADFILVCNHLDAERMQQDGVTESKIAVLYGGVDLQAIHQIAEPQNKSFEGCFVGRFHVQKGVLVLIDIWARVVRRFPHARLAVIGEGPLFQEMRQTIHALKLERNISILGYLDGDEKYRVLKASRVFLHTPTHDTGGMAAAEAMACGLPVVGFDLPGYQYCYPKGMSKVPIGDLDAFAGQVLELLSNQLPRRQLQREALEFVQSWDWSLRASVIEDVFHRLLDPSTDAQKTFP